VLALAAQAKTLLAGHLWVMALASSQAEGASLLVGQNTEVESSFVVAYILAVSMVSIPERQQHQ
jgi:hypothetical protein